MDIWDLVRRDAECGAERMVAEYGNRLLAAATLVCRNDVDAEELVFRTFEQAVKKIRQFKPTGDFYKWLYTIMLNFRRMDVRKPDVVAFGTTADLPEVPIASFIDVVSAADASAVAGEGVRSCFGGCGCLFGGGRVCGWAASTGCARAGADCHGDASFGHESLETGISWLFP